ncbi:hypothetical protein Tco_1493481 [Tanacetum coccineum]
MVQLILNRVEGKLLVVVDDEHVHGLIGDVSLVMDEQLVLEKIGAKPLVIQRLEVNNIIEQLVRDIDDTEVKG